MALGVYAASCPGATAYDQYARMADALLSGALSLPSRPPHLELAELNGRAYFTNPPSPGLLLVPIVWLAHREPIRSWLVAYNGGWDLPLGLLQTGLSVFLGALNVALARLALGRAPLTRTAANLGAILFGFGSIAWYHSTIGSVWYVAQVVHATAMWLCVLEWLGKQRAALLGLALAFAFWARMETIVVAPFVLVGALERWFAPPRASLLRRVSWRWLIAFAAPLAGVVALNCGYNWLRFGTIENWGYRMLVEKPEVAPMFPHGHLSVWYVPNHVQMMFRQPPIFLNEFPWVVPSVAGMSIWWTTPAFLWAFRAPLDRITTACWLGILLFVGVVFQHGGTGMTQLGYRFALDFYPLLTLLTARGMDRPLRAWHFVAVGLCVALNAWWVCVLNVWNIQRLY